MASGMRVPDHSSGAPQADPRFCLWHCQAAPCPSPDLHSCPCRSFVLTPLLELSSVSPSLGGRGSRGRGPAADCPHHTWSAGAGPAVLPCTCLPEARGLSICKELNTFVPTSVWVASFGG